MQVPVNQNGCFIKYGDSCIYQATQLSNGNAQGNDWMNLTYSIISQV